MYDYARFHADYCNERQQEEDAEAAELSSADRLSVSAWKGAQSPNYDRNENLFYPYSELDCVGEYALLRLPAAPQRLVRHVDYWGEGRLVTEAGVAGFPDCYNVNEQHKLVSSGADADRKIPNRIPVFSSTDCDTSDYISDESVQLVTISGARISRRCARDVARIVARHIGLVVAFGYEDDSEDIKILERALGQKNFMHRPNHRLPPSLSGVAARDSRRAYVHIEYLDRELQRNIAERNFDEALRISRVMKANKYSTTIYNVVSKMLNEGSRAGHAPTLLYAHRLWRDDERDIVAHHLPAPFAPILNGQNIKIVHNKYNLPLKLDEFDDVSLDSKLTDVWRCIPVWENNNLYFKIQNVGNKLFLTLDNDKTYGKSKIYGGSPSHDLKFQWSLVPLIHDNVLMFYIVNKQYVDGLTMDTEIKKGTRHIISVEGTINEPDIYGWKIY